MYFIALARIFGPDKYGAFIGIIAIISLFLPFANWGSSKILIQNVSRDQSLIGECYGTSILKTLVFGSIFISIVLFISVLYPIPNISIYSVFLLSLSNFIFMVLSDNCRDTFISVGLINCASKVTLMLSVNRFLGALALIAFTRTPTLLMWSVVYCMATFVTAVTSSIMASNLVGRPRFKPFRIFKDLRQGFAFSVSDSAENIYNDLDKAMLAKLSTVESVAIYGAAYHLLNVSFLPMQAIMLATYRGFFQAGASGIKASLGFAKKIVPIALGYSTLAIILTLLLSPLIPKLLGEGYVDSTLALMLLSPTILFKSLHRLAADILTGANYQRVRSVAQVFTALFNGILNIWLIALYQWRCAIWSTLISECLLMIILWGFIYVYCQKSQENLVPVSHKK